MNLWSPPDALQGAWIAAAVLLPLLLAGFPAATRLAALAPLPALALAFAAPFEVQANGLLLGARFGVHPGNAPFLLLASVLWLAATAFARPYMAHDADAGRYHVFHRLAMAGNLGLILALDLASFYCFFALMSLASYPLVIHDGRNVSRRAGRVYLALALAGEILQFAAFSMIAAEADGWSFDAAQHALLASPHRPAILLTALAGFGIKAGLVPLHVWLPLAHPVAPTPASAVLSGSMIKAGLLGWLNVIPFGAMTSARLSEALIMLGLCGVFGAALAGVTQRQPKAVLAYSSISQMGLMILACGIGMGSADAMRAVFPALLLYALHHALAKGALFLGVGMATSAPRGRWGGALLWIGLMVPALALAGFPYTSGAAAKIFLKAAAAEAPGEWPARLALLLSLGAVGTTLLMIRFLWTLRPALAHEPDADHRADRAIWWPWLGLLALVLSASWWMAFELAPEKARAALSAKYLMGLGWPIATGLALGLFAIAARATKYPEIPAGDLLALPLWLGGRIAGFYRLHRPTLGARVRAADDARGLAREGLKNLLRTLAGTERYLRTLSVAGILFALLAAWMIWGLGKR